MDQSQIYDEIANRYQMKVNLYFFYYQSDSLSFIWYIHFFFFEGYRISD